MQSDRKIKILKYFSALIIAAIFLLINIAPVFAAVDYQANPSSCPASDSNFPGQECPYPESICGNNSGIAQCYDTLTLNPPVSSTTSSSQYSGGLGGGYIVDCFASVDSAQPYCDNNGSYWCNSDSTCLNSEHRQTQCNANKWSGASGAYTCTASCVSGYYDCDSTGSDCEKQNGGACTVGSLSGTYSCALGGSMCSGTAGGTKNYTCTCVVSKTDFQTGTQSSYSSSGGTPLFWGTESGTDNLLQLSNNIGGTTSTNFIVGNIGTGITLQDLKVLNINNTNATFDTTAGAINNYGEYIVNNASRSAGSGALTNVGLYVSAYGAQNNYGLIVGTGSAVFNGGIDMAAGVTNHDYWMPTSRGNLGQCLIVNATDTTSWGSCGGLSAGASVTDTATNPNTVSFATGNPSYQGYAINASGTSYFSNSTYSATLARASAPVYAGNFTDAVHTATLANGTYAVNALGPSNFNDTSSTAGRVTILDFINFNASIHADVYHLNTAADAGDFHNYYNNTQVLLGTHNGYAINATGTSHFTDGSNDVFLTNGTYAINASGNAQFLGLNGNTARLGNVNGFAVEGQATQAGYYGARFEYGAYPFTNSVILGSPSYAINASGQSYFSDGSNDVFLTNGSNAIYATGQNYFTTSGVNGTTAVTIDNGLTNGADQRHIYIGQVLPSSLGTGLSVTDNGSHTVSLIDGSGNAINATGTSHFTDGSNDVFLTNGTNAIYTTSANQYGTANFSNTYLGTTWNVQIGNPYNGAIYATDSVNTVNLASGYGAGYFVHGSNSVTLADLAGTYAINASGNILASGTATFTQGVVTKDNASAPTLPSTNGMIQVGKDGSAYRLYFYSNGDQKYINSNGSFDIPGSEAIDPVSGEQMKIGDYVVGMLDKNEGDSENSIHGVWVKLSSIPGFSNLASVNSSGTVGNGGVPGVQTSGTLLENVKNILSTLGISIVDGVTNITTLATKNFSTKTATVKYLQMIAANGDVYCTWIDNDGNLQKAKGECANIDTASYEIVAPATPQQTPPAVNTIQTPQQTQPQVLNINSVAPISDINVAYGTALSSVGLPQAVTATLSNAATEPVNVTWDNGTPTYDANTAGTYIFSGTLIFSGNTTNTESLRAAVNVIMAPQSSGGSPTAEGPSILGSASIQRAVSNFFTDIGGFVKFLFSSLLEPIKNLLPK